MALGGPATPRPTLRYTYFLAMGKRKFILNMLLIAGVALALYANTLRHTLNMGLTQMHLSNALRLDPYHREASGLLSRIRAGR